MYIWKRKNNFQKKEKWMLNTDTIVVLYGNILLHIFNNNDGKRLIFSALLPIFPLNNDRASAYKNGNCFDMGFILTKARVEKEIKSKSTPHYFTLFQFPLTYQSLKLAVDPEHNKSWKAISYWKKKNTGSTRVYQYTTSLSIRSYIDVIIIWTNLIFFIIPYLYPHVIVNRAHVSRQSCFLLLNWQSVQYIE